MDLNLQNYEHAETFENIVFITTINALFGKNIINNCSSFLCTEKFAQITIIVCEFKSSCTVLVCLHFKEGLHNHFRCICGK